MADTMIEQRFDHRLWGHRLSKLVTGRRIEGNLLITHLHSHRGIDSAHLRYGQLGPEMLATHLWPQIGNALAASSFVLCRAGEEFGRRWLWISSEIICRSPS